MFFSVKKNAKGLQPLPLYCKKDSATANTALSFAPRNNQIHFFKATEVTKKNKHLFIFLISSLSIKVPFLTSEAHIHFTS